MTSGHVHTRQHAGMGLQESAQHGLAGIRTTWACRNPHNMAHGRMRWAMGPNCANTFPGRDAGNKQATFSAPLPLMEEAAPNATSQKTSSAIVSKLPRHFDRPSGRTSKQHNQCLPQMEEAGRCTPRAASRSATAPQTVHLMGESGCLGPPGDRPAQAITQGRAGGPHTCQAQCALPLHILYGMSTYHTIQLGREGRDDCTSINHAVV
jgi:hypothetical protein